MRIYTALLTILTLGLLSACGESGGDVTNPPEPQRFTLTVSGTGTGSGQVVVTSSAAEPVLDCTLTGNGGSTGLCSGSYPEGTAVTLTVAPDENSTFTGWAGDISICAASTSCSITITHNTTAVAQLVQP